jgi:hypothetical protein
MRVLIKGGVWKNTEDEILKAAVMKYGKNQWDRAASLLSRKSAKQCKARWYEWLDPSIKKTEWHRDEEEKLLHLAKLMPNQWRTIAPIVGRTAAQCMEHYEKLLDQAQESAENAGSSSSGATGAADDPRRLRPGEIDPTPETKPARPDPIDMDDDEKEMLSEARARLANTMGKKSKRKARERQLEEARKLTVLQKRRELRAAGLESKLGGGAKKRKYIDYAKEIPFQKVAPAGFYDIGEENEQSRKLSKSINPRQMGLDIATLEGRHATEDAEREKAQDQARLKKLFKANAPLAVMKVNNEQDAAVSLRRRTALSLPSPQVSDIELEDIVRMGQHNMNTLAAIEDEEGHGSGATQGLIGDYNTVYAPQLQSSGAGVGAAARTPMHEDIVMQEARNQRVLREMTPLVDNDDGKGLGTLYEGTGFQGMAPRKTAMATPNTVLGATPGHGMDVGAATPMSMASYGTKQSSSIRASKSALVRDQFGLNDPTGVSVRAGPIATAAAAGDIDIDIDSVYGDDVDDRSMVSVSTFGGSGGRRFGSGPVGLGSQGNMLTALKSLPEPEFTYKFKVPELPQSRKTATSASRRVTVEDADDDEEDDERNGHGQAFLQSVDDDDDNYDDMRLDDRRGGSSDHIEDRADAEERESRHRVELQERELRSRSTVFQRAHRDIQSVLRPVCVSKALLQTSMSLAEGPEQMIHDELCTLVAYDSYLSPVEPAPVLDSDQSLHSNTCIAALTASSNTKGGVMKYPGTVSSKLLQQARALVEEEMVAQMPFDEFCSVWEDVYKSISYVPEANGGAGGFVESVNKAEVSALNRTT